MFLAKLNKKEGIETAHDQQYKINKTDFVMNYILVYTVGECPLLNMNIDPGDHKGYLEPLVYYYY